MLRRLQEKKSEYELSEYKKEWKKTKKMIQNITSYPIAIDNFNIRRKRKASMIDISELKNIANTAPE